LCVVWLPDFGRYSASFRAWSDADCGLNRVCFLGPDNLEARCWGYRALWKPLFCIYALLRIASRLVKTLLLVAPNWDTINGCGRTSCCLA
jgi:hypothetical protein